MKILHIQMQEQHIQKGRQNNKKVQLRGDENIAHTDARATYSKSETE